MEMRDDESKLYPELPAQQPSAPSNIYGTIELPSAKELSKVSSQASAAPQPVERTAQTFRLQKINEIKSFLEFERDSRRQVAKSIQELLMY